MDSLAGFDLEEAVGQGVDEVSHVPHVPFVHGPAKDALKQWKESFVR